MLRTRVIPVVLLDGYSVLKTIRFDVRRNLGNPITVARIYDSRGVDELVLLDIDASKQGRHIDEYTIENIASDCFMPLSVGGGLRSNDQISTVLRKGADKVILNTVAIESPEFVTTAAREFGSQCVLASIDYRIAGSERKVYSHVTGGSRGDLVAWAREMEDRGAGEIVLNSVDLDGTMSGYDLEGITMVSNAVTIPVIATGGAGEAADGAKAVEAGASAMAAASIFHFTSVTPRDVKTAMSERGLPVRL